MDVSLSSGSESGPLVATLLADALLEQSWIATAPETWFAAPLIVSITCALALARARQLDAPDAGFLQSIRPECGARAAIRAALREPRRLTGARAAMIALDGPSSSPVLRLSDVEGGEAATEIRALSSGEHATYFPVWPPKADAHEPLTIVTFEASSDFASPRFRQTHAFETLEGMAFRHNDCDGRMFLLDPAPDCSRETLLRDFERLLRQIIPAVARVCDLHARRHRAADHADWKLSIQDDGRGFVAGRRAQPAAAARAVVPPSVIHERVRSIGGTIRVVAPGAPGARLEIAARRRNPWNRGA